MSSGSSTPNAKTCETCRHHSARMAPKPHKHADELMDGSFFVVDDALQKVYSCKATAGDNSPYAGQEIGPTPITCPSWEAPPKQPSERDTRMHDLLSAWEARQRGR